MRHLHSRDAIARRGERASGFVLAVLVLFVACVALAVVAHSSRIVATRAHLQSVADSAALAALVDGRDEAERLVNANHAQIVRFEVDQHGVSLTVRRADLSASASASYAQCRGSCVGRA